MSTVVKNSRRAFTLIEVMVASAVLVIIVLLLTQILNGGITAMTSGRSRLDADSEARTVLDRIGRDIAQMVVRKDADINFVKAAGNDSFFFFSQAPGFFNTTTAADQSPLSLVGYRVNTGYQLERLGKGLTWGGATAEDPSMIFLTFPASTTANPTPTPLPTSQIKSNSQYSGLTTTASNYDMFSDQVFRVEICYLLTDGTYSDRPYITTDPGYGLRDVAGIVVTIALLDKQSQKIVESMAPAANALPDFTPPSSGNPVTLPAKGWEDAVTGGSFATTANIPQKAASKIRVYQRVFYLNRP